MFNDGQAPGGDPPQQPLQPLQNRLFAPNAQVAPELLEQLQRMLQIHSRDQIWQALHVQNFMQQNIMLPNLLQVATPQAQFVVPPQGSPNPLLLAQNPAFAAAHSVEQFIAQEEGRVRAPSPVRQVPVVQVQPQVVQPVVLPTPMQVSPPQPPIHGNPIQDVPVNQNSYPPTPHSTSSRGSRTGRRGGGRKKKTGETPPRQVDEALAYLRVIKQTFCDDVPVYHRFLDIMKDFRAQRIDTPDVIEQVAELLYTSPELVLGFNTFLPAGFRISQNAERKYVFTAPQALPKVLPSPEERQANAAPAKQPDLPSVTSGPSGDDVENGTGDKSDVRKVDEKRGGSVESGETENEEDEENDDEIVEEVVLKNKKVDEELELMDDEKTDKTLEAEALRVVELLADCFRARPSKIVDFVTLMEYCMAHSKYYETTAEGDEKEGVGHKNGQWMVSSIAHICQGEPELLATIVDFLPYLKDLIDKYGNDAVKKMCELMRKPSTACNSPEKTDRELSAHLEATKMGTSSFEMLQNELLRISKKRKASSESDEDRECQQLIVLGKTHRVLYQLLKERTSEHQMNSLLTLFGMYMNMDLTAERLAGEVSKVMGVQGSEVEKSIRKMLGIDVHNKQRPENDPDAVKSRNLPAPQHAKRGLRDQKMLQQVKNVEAATVCTLGPSYRLMKDTNPKEVDCSGRIELEPHLKEVINDTWTSYPSWSSEDPGSQAVKKSNLEEFHFKTEEERYELDIIVDSNRTIIEQLSKTLRDFDAMNDDEKRHFRLDEALNCSSKATVTRVLTKVYTNSANEMMEAAQRNPQIGIRKLLEGLKEKDVQWSRFQQDTNRTWRDALDKQMTSAISTLNTQQKQYDQKAFKSKPLVNAIEQVLEERRKNNCDDGRPHLTLDYTPEERIYRDVNDVTSHFFHDLPGGKSDKERTKLVLFRILMEWVCQPGQNVQIDMDNGDVFKFQGDLHEDENLLTVLNADNRRMRAERLTPVSPSANTTTNTTHTKERFVSALHERKKRVFYGDDNVYMIIRYHHMIVERFAKLMATQAVYNQEHLDNRKKHKRWEEGVGAEMHGRRVLDENMRTRREAVHDIRNIRTCPSSYYDIVIRELKQLGNAQTDLASFEESARSLFPADVVLFNSIDKLLSSLAKNIHHATCADERENAVKLYLRFRSRMEDVDDGHARRMAECEYATAADETLRGKNTYRFEFVDEPNAPHCNVWVIPREEKESSAAENDDDEVEKEGGVNEEEMPAEKPTSNDDDEEDEDSEGGTAVSTGTSFC